MSDHLEPMLHRRPFISDDGEHRTLHFSIDDVQSSMCPARPFELEVAYTKTMMGFLLTIPNPVHILMIGLGGGSIAKFCHRHLPATRMTVVEINPHVIAVRRQFLIPDDDERLRVVCADGIDFVPDIGPQFDVILVDGYAQHGLAAQLCSQSFYRDCWKAMRERSVLAVNLDAGHPAHATFVARIEQSFHGNAVPVDVNERGNCVVFAGKGVPMSARGMSLSWSLERHAAEAQVQLRPEFQRILRVLERGANSSL